MIIHQVYKNAWEKIDFYPANRLDGGNYTRQYQPHGTNNYTKSKAIAIIKTISANRRRSNDLLGITKRETRPRPLHRQSGPHSQPQLPGQPWHLRYDGQSQGDTEQFQYHRVRPAVPLMTEDLTQTVTGCTHA